MFYKEEEFGPIQQAVTLVDYSPGYRLGDFDCEIKEYNEFLTDDAPIYISQNISQVKLLIDKKKADVIGYIALLSDSFLLTEEEKEKEGLDIPFATVPALKVGKLATDHRYRDKPYGSFLLWIAYGLAEKLNATGIACRFLVVDADIRYRKDLPRFYEKNGFVINEKMHNKERTKSISMRLDIFQG